jgi:hypothetical protein
MMLVNRKPSPTEIAVAFIGAVAAAALACKTPQKKVDTFTVQRDYKSAYSVAKDYVEKCTQRYKVRANLYTEFPEAEIIIDYMPGNSLMFVGGAVSTTTSSAQEVLNIRFKGAGKSTEISTHDKLSRLIAEKAMASKATCPTEAEIKSL